MALEGPRTEEALLTDSGRVERQNPVTQAVEASEELMALDAALEAVAGQVDDLLEQAEEPQFVQLTLV